MCFVGHSVHAVFNRAFVNNVDFFQWRAIPFNTSWLLNLSASGPSLNLIWLSFPSLSIDKITEKLDKP